MFKHSFGFSKKKSIDMKLTKKLSVLINYNKKINVMNKISFIIFALSFFINSNLWAQGVAINENGDNPDNSAMLDVTSTTKGVLIPRMTMAQRDTISSPATGLMVYQMDNTSGFYYFDGTSWDLIGTGAFAIDDLSDGISEGSSVFLGLGAGTNDDGTSNQNVAVGINALNTNTSGHWNTATGYMSLYSNTTGKENTANGYQALYSNTTGNHNTATGFWSLKSNTTGHHNTANGYAVLLENTTGYYNTGIGHNALNHNTTGIHNTANGFQPLGCNTTGDNNTATGSHAIYSNTTGNNNTATGYYADYYNQEGSNNTIIGYEAGMGDSTHNKSGNVFLGYQSGYNETGDNKLYIENSDTTSPLIYGEFDNDLVTLNGNLGIGTTLFGSGTRTLALYNGTAPTSSISDGVLLYSEDESSSAELKVRDEAGNVTTLSPHNFSMINKSEPMAWSFYSENADVGKKINVDMLKAVRLIEKVTGEKLAYVENIEEDPDNTNIEENTIGIIQQQQKDITELQIFIEGLKKQNKELLKRIEKLEEK